MIRLKQFRDLYLFREDIWEIRGQNVHVVVVSAALTLNFEGFSLSIRETISRNKTLGVVFIPNSKILTFENWGSLRLKFRVREVVNYAETQILSFAIKYLSKNEKTRQTVLTCSTIGVENLVTPFL